MLPALARAGRRVNRGPGRVGGSTRQQVIQIRNAVPTPALAGIKSSAPGSPSEVPAVARFRRGGSEVSVDGTGTKAADRRGCAPGSGSAVPPARVCVSQDHVQVARVIAASGVFKTLKHAFVNPGIRR